MNLAAKIAAVAAEMKKVPKNGTNKNDGYKYAMAADVFDAVREHLAAQKVAVIPQVDSAVSTIIAREKGVLATLWIDYTFVDGESEDKLTARIVSTAADYGMADKAVFKAETNALKYLLFQVFQISTGDDDVERDADAPKGEEPKQRAKRTTAKAEPSIAEMAAAKLAEPAALPVPAITEDQRADIRFLNEALPKENQWGNKALRSQLVALGADGLVKALVGDHKKYHADACTHYADAPDGRLVVKRAA